MDEIARLKHQLAQAEALLNVLDALRPDLPARELYELALQMIGGAGEYLCGSLWIYEIGYYRAVVCEGLERTRTALIPGATLSAAEFERLLDQCQTRAGVHWRQWPLAPGTPAVLCPPEGEGHTLILPLAFIDQIGFVALEGSAPRPGDEILATLGRFADKTAVALDTARVFQDRMRTIEELQRVTEEQHQLQATVLELSAPLLPLLPGVLVLPLVGAIDVVRAERILETELQAIIREHTEVVLVDITGTSVVDTSVAMQLVRSADAARLLGCRTILVGVQPEIAQTLVGLGVDLRGIDTRSTLAEGLQMALGVVRRRLVDVDGQAGDKMTR
jgi:anti-anti-sigma regulatory factor